MSFSSILSTHIFEVNDYKFRESLTYKDMFDFKEIVNFGGWGEGAT